jgi:SAGA-associated factor 73
MGAKRSVPGRSRPYDDLLLEWQKANNPAFLAKLERREEEKAKAMEERRAKKIGKDKKLLKKGMKDARRKDGMRHAADSAALLQEESENDLLPAMDAYLANDGSGHLTEGGALDDPRGKVEVEYKDLLRSLRARLWNDERVISRPVARRSYHGLHTGQARRFLTIRQAFAGGVGGSSSSSSGLLPVGTNAKAGGPLDGGAAGGFKTPIVAGGGWMFS